MRRISAKLTGWLMEAVCPITNKTNVSVRSNTSESKHGLSTFTKHIANLHNDVNYTHQLQFITIQRLLKSVYPQNPHLINRSRLIPLFHLRHVF